MVSPNPFRAVLAACLLVCVPAARAANAAAVEELLKAPRQAEPEIAPASDQGEQAMVRMRVPEPFRLSLWAAEPMLANPVAFTIDERGRFFVAETYRYRTSTLDIRDFIGPMLERDLASRTIEDRMQVIDDVFGAAGRRELSIESERIRLVEDRDGDGTADFSSIYAEGFNHPLDGIASGVLARGDRVWFTNIPSLWLLEGTDAQGRALRRTELSRGYGVRFNYTGHDLHGLILGPDGKLYFSVGDRGAHVVTREGAVLDVPDMGAVFRSDPDGSNLEVFATGLRNPQELAFDEHGNLWTGDNDSDQGDIERLVHVVEGGDSGWRVGYQFAPLGRAGPWNLEKLWHPRFPEQAAYFLAPVGNIEDGPSGLDYYPGTGLGDRYKGHLFVTHFRGGSARSGIYTYSMEPDGASFRLRTSEPFLRFALPTDTMFGADGRLYFSDWDEGWPKSRKGRLYAITNPETIDDPLVRETERLLRGGFRERSLAELSTLLGHADQRVRQESQFELARREQMAPLVAVARNLQSQPLARLHAIWGLGQVARHNRRALEPLPALLRDSDPEVRAQSAKVLGELKEMSAFDALVAALRDDAPRVRFFAAQSLGKLGRREATAPLLELLRANGDADAYLRHAAVMGLVGTRDADVLAAGAADPDRSVRLGVLLAYRRLGDSAAAQFLNDADPLIALEAARAINDQPINAALPALAARLNDVAGDELFALRALNAHFRLGAETNAGALAAFAARDSASDTLRAEAVTHLGAWGDPPDRDRIVGVYRPLGERDGAVAARVLEPMLPSLLTGGAPEAVQLATLGAVEALELHGASNLLFDLVANTGLSSRVRREALALLDQFDDARLSEAVLLAGASENSALRLAALPVAARLSPADALPVIKNLMEDGSAAEKRAAYRALAEMADPRSLEPLLADLDRLEQGEIPAPVQLDLLEAAAARTEPAVAERLARREARLTASADPLARFRVALEGGDRDRGSTLFREHPVLACIRCHKVGSEGGGEVGPDLTTIGRDRPNDHLLESIVRPNAKLAPGFEIATVTLQDGSVHTGSVREESATTLTLVDPDGAPISLEKSRIARRDTTPSSMPDIYRDTLTLSELRDLVAYLASLREPPAPPPPPRVGPRPVG